MNFFDNDYLLKPITFTRFFKAINKYLDMRTDQAPPRIQEREAPQPEHLFVNVQKKHIKILFNDILYTERIKDYIRIHTIEKGIVTKEKISSFAEKLPQNFLRVHRSYIVNLSKVTAYTARDVEIEEREIPIGISYKKLVVERLG